MGSCGRGLDNPSSLNSKDRVTGDEQSEFRANVKVMVPLSFDSKSKLLLVPSLNGIFNPSL